MKNTALSSLFVFALLELPRSVHSFTAATTRPQPPLAGGPAVSRSRTTLLHGLKLPDFLARTPEPAEAPPETMELALEATAAETSSAETIAGKEGEEGPTETQTLLQKVKQAGTAGAVSYALWELGFWGVSIPVCVLGYREVAGHWPDFSNKEDLEKVGAEAFAFVNFARLAVPLRIGLALSTTPWIDENVVRKFMKKEEQ